MTPRERAERVIRIMTEGDLAMDNLTLIDLIQREIEEAVREIWNMLQEKK